MQVVIYIFMEMTSMVLVRMEELLSRRVIGQRDPLVAVANAIRRSRAGLQDPEHPLTGTHGPAG